MDVRAAVVAATQDELIENGCDALSVERVAERANLEPAAVRANWRDADELIALVFDEHVRHARRAGRARGGGGARRCACGGISPRTG